MKRFRLALLVVPGLALLGAPSAPAESVPATKLFLWKATSDTTQVYLMGSIHAGKESWYPMAKEIEDAWGKSKFLVLEMDQSKMDPDQQLQILQKGQYAEGDTLGKHIPEDLMKKVNAFCESSGIPASGIEKFKPWLLAVTVQILFAQKLGYTPQYGVDMHFLADAKTKGKEVLELESAEFQINLISGLSEEMQIKFLGSSLDDEAKMKEQFEGMVDAWTKGDGALLEKMAITQPLAQHPDTKPLMAKMLDDRNVEMVKKIQGYLKTKDAHFVVVGAAHLVGEKGLVSLLKKEGVKVEQIEKQ